VPFQFACPGALFFASVFVRLCWNVCGDGQHFRLGVKEGERRWAIFT
jgi:hypothetical protein